MIGGTPKVSGEENKESDNKIKENDNKEKNEEKTNNDKKGEEKPKKKTNFSFIKKKTSKTQHTN